MRVVLTILPPCHPYYQDREVFALIPGLDPVYATDNAAALTRSRARLKVVQPRFVTPPGFSQGVRSALGRVASIESLLNDVAPDLVVTFELHSRISSDVARLRAQLGFRHLVVAYETTTLNQGLWSLFPLTRSWGLHTAKVVDRCLAYSNRTQRALVSAGVAQSRIIRTYPGIYLEESTSPGETRQAPQNQVLFVGSLRSNKGLITLVKAMAVVRTSPELRGRDPGLVIAGKGPLEEYVRECARTRPWIDFRGYISDDERQRLYLSSKLFVCPSEDIRWGRVIRWEEQTATAVIEAMSAGLPVIGSDSGVLPELLGDPSLISKQRSPTALASRIQHLLLNDSFRKQKSDENLTRGRRDFDIHTVARYIGENIATFSGQG